MEYLNNLVTFLDGISPLQFMDTHGYTVWIYVRDTLAWILSIAAWIVTGIVWYEFTRYMRNIKKDEAGIIVEGSQGNIFFSALSIRSGFHDNFQQVKKDHPDFSVERVLGRTYLRRKIATWLLAIAAAALFGFLGAEWGVVALVPLCWRVLTTDEFCRDYYYVYRDYLDLNYEDHE